MTAVLAVDLGKTRCRVRLAVDGQVLSGVGHGVPGLADHLGPERAADAVIDALAQVSDPLPAIGAVGIGAAGAEAAPDATARFADLVAARIGAPVAVASDAVTAHAGAFAGAPGTVVIVGTGTALLTLGDAGTFTQIDGWGPWLGDEGSGRWIGQEGLRAVLAAHDGRGPATALVAAARGLHEPLHELPRWVSEDGAPARRLAAFAPLVLDAARDGDAVAGGIVDRAVTAVVDACRATTGPFCLHGGIAESDVLGPRLEQGLGEAGLVSVRAAGDALTGAALVAAGTVTSYEGMVVRSELA